MSEVFGEMALVGGGGSRHTKPVTCNISASISISLLHGVYLVGSNSFVSLVCAIDARTRTTKIQTRGTYVEAGQRCLLVLNVLNSHLSRETGSWDL